MRLVFYIFKPLRGAAVRAVKQLEFGEYPVEYAFIHVKDESPFFRSLSVFSGTLWFFPAYRTVLWNVRPRRSSQGMGHLRK